jgi:SAM-dependent methyltransferase
MELYQSYFDANKASWNKRTEVHKDSDFYELDAFKNGKSSLHKIELNEIGDVTGKSLLHLQCHFGMDTMSWARAGAKCVGIDFSDEAIHLARAINEELKLDTEFVCANIFDITDISKVKETGRFKKAGFDIVFTSYGTIGWLPDLEKWGEAIAYFLKPGGIFYIADFHPTLWMMDENFEKIKYNYFNTEVITEEISGTYADRNAAIKSTEHGWNHPFSEIINTLIKHNLQIEHFNEFPFSPCNCFNNIVKGDDDMWRIKDMNEKMPMMYSIKATKR